MNLRKSGRTLVLAAAVAMLAMGLQGCGGDDGISQDRLDEEVAKAAAEQKAAEEARKKAEADEKAKMEAEAATREARKAAMEADAARKEAEKAAMEADAAKATAEAKATADAAAKAAADARAAAAETARQAAADKAKELEDKAEAARKTAAHAQAEKDRVALSDARMRRGKSSGLTNAEQAANQMSTSIHNDLKLTSSTLKAEFPGYEQDERPDAIAGWAGATLVKPANKEDKIVVYTNQADTKALLSTFYNASTLPNGKLSFAITTNGANKTFTWGTNGNVKGDPGNAIATVGVSTNATNTLVGKVLGAIPGTFTCTGAVAATGTGTCGLVSATATATGLVPNGSGWTFTPTDANAMWYGDYLLFGWWKNTTPSPNGSFDVFYKRVGNARRRAGATGTDLKGTATYTGPAAGRYAIRNDTVKDGTESGAFTARARLFLNFDVDRWEHVSASSDTRGILMTGTIDQFKGKYAGIGNWKVRLTVDGATGVVGSQGAALAAPGRTAGLQSFDWLGVTDQALGGSTTGNIITRYMAEWSLDGEVYVSETVTAGKPGHYASEGTDPQPTGRFTADFWGGTGAEPPEMAAAVFYTNVAHIAELMGAFVATKD